MPVDLLFVRLALVPLVARKRVLRVVRRARRGRLAVRRRARLLCVGALLARLGVMRRLEVVQHLLGGLTDMMAARGNSQGAVTSIAGAGRSTHLASVVREPLVVRRSLVAADNMVVVLRAEQAQRQLEITRSIEQDRRPLHDMQAQS